MGFAFLFWGCIGLLSSVNEFFHNPALQQVIDLNAKIFQPAFRLILGIWMWKQVRIKRAFA